MCEAYRIKGIKPKIQNNLVKLLQQNVACSTIRNNAGHILRQFCCNTKVPDLFINEFIPIPVKQSYRNEMKDSTANSGVDNQTIVTLQKEIKKIHLDIK